jgi:hypothetical protein
MLGRLRGVRHALRNFTALAVREHLRSETEANGGAAHLTDNELALVRFIVEGTFDWKAFLAERATRERLAKQTPCPQGSAGSP